MSELNPYRIFSAARQDHMAWVYLLAYVGAIGLLAYLLIGVR